MERGERTGGSVVVLGGFFMGLRGKKGRSYEFHLRQWAWWLPVKVVAGVVIIL